QRDARPALRGDARLAAAGCATCAGERRELRRPPCDGRRDAKVAAPWPAADAALSSDPHRRDLGEPTRHSGHRRGCVAMSLHAAALLQLASTATADDEELVATFVCAIILAATRKGHPQEQIEKLLTGAAAALIAAALPLLSNVDG